MTALHRPGSARLQPPSGSSHQAVVRDLIAELGGVPPVKRGGVVQDDSVLIGSTRGSHRVCIWILALMRLTLRVAGDVVWWPGRSGAGREKVLT